MRNDRLINEQLETDIANALKQGLKYREIVSKYNTNHMAIARVKKRLNIEVVKEAKQKPIRETGMKNERLISHYYFTGVKQADSFLENCF